MKFVRIAILAVVAATALVAVADSPAAARVPSNPNQIRQVWTLVYGTTNTTVHGKVDCPAGMQVVSPGADQAYIFSLAPTPDFRSVEAVGQIRYAAPSNYMIIYANCAADNLFNGITSSSVFLYGAANQPRAGVAWCPAGYIAFGGGGYVFAADGSQSLSAYPMLSNAVSASGQGWTFAANTASGEPIVINTRCAPAQGTWVKSSNVILSPSGSSVGADCGPNYLAVSGGVYLAKADGTGREANGSVTQSIWLGAGRWYVSGASDSRTNPGAKLVALAQCVPLNSI
jgi:hypothetical protein